MFGLKSVVRYLAFHITYKDDRVYYFRSELEMLRELVTLSNEQVSYYGAVELCLDEARAIFGSKEEKY